MTRRTWRLQSVKKRGMVWLANGIAEKGWNGGRRGGEERRGVMRVWKESTEKGKTETEEADEERRVRW